MEPPTLDDLDDETRKKFQKVAWEMFMESVEKTRARSLEAIRKAHEEMPRGDAAGDPERRR